MSYENTLDKKNKILCWILGISILLRCVTNSLFVDFVTVIPLAAASFVIVILLRFLIKVIKNPVTMMYLMVIFISTINIILMWSFPCIVNYMMFFLDIFFVIIYEDIRPIAIQCTVSAAAMIYFYFGNTADLLVPWDVDVMIMFVVYIISGLFVFIALCRISRQSFAYLEQVNKENLLAKEKSDMLLDRISQSVHNLSIVNDGINESITNTYDMTKDIIGTSETVSKKMTEEVTAVKVIKNLVEEGSSQMQEVSESSSQMTMASNQTDDMVSVGNQHVNQLSAKMRNVNTNIEDIERSINELNGENSKIIEIIDSLKEIASQTNLLALNASIEAARAGEEGRGFAVVAEEIRKLAEHSNQFNEQINQIIDGVGMKTKQVAQVINTGKQEVEECGLFANEVKDSFETISRNTKTVLSQSMDIDEKSKLLAHLFKNAASNIETLHHNAESTAEAMESITDHVEMMNEKMNVVVQGYDEINEITKGLVATSK